MQLIFPYVSAALFVSMLIATRLAYHLAFGRIDPLSKESRGVEAAIFGLLGLLVAFTFAGAHSRFETRRQIVVEEANAIGTLFLRLDMLPKETRQEVQSLCLEYVDSRIRFWEVLVDPKEGYRELLYSQGLQQQIWKKIVATTNDPSMHQTRNLLIPALNTMFDIVTKRTFAILTHTSIWMYLIFLTIIIICNILLGTGMARIKKYSWSQVAIFSAVVSIIVYRSRFKTRLYTRLFSVLA